MRAGVEGSEVATETTIKTAESEYKFIGPRSYGCALQCFEIDGSRYLRQDSSINCEDSSHEVFELVDALFISLYMLIPCTWLLLLYRVRHRLLPPGVVDDELVVTLA